MRIAIDVMGGDHAPDATIEGCLAARAHLRPDTELLLFGDERAIRGGLGGGLPDAFRVTATSDAGRSYSAA